MRSPSFIPATHPHRRRVERRSRTAGTQTVRLARCFQAVLEGREHGGTLEWHGARQVDQHRPSAAAIATASMCVIVLTRRPPRRSTRSATTWARPAAWAASHPRRPAAVDDASSTTPVDTMVGLQPGGTSLREGHACACHRKENVAESDCWHSSFIMALFSELVELATEANIPRDEGQRNQGLEASLQAR